MTSTHSSGWRDLAVAVLARAIADLDPSLKGFSACHIEELPRWQRDAEAFFDERRFLLWALAAGYDAGEVERAYLRISQVAEPQTESERTREARREWRRRK
jgi:hypothetical protein